jgi:hypothetical protein
VQRAFVPPPAQDNARRLDDVRGARREVREGNRVLIEEPGRVIVEEGGRAIIRHNDADRFRWQAQDVRIERRGADYFRLPRLSDRLAFGTSADGDHCGRHGDS